MASAIQVLPVPGGPASIPAAFLRLASLVFLQEPIFPRASRLATTRRWACARYVHRVLSCCREIHRHRLLIVADGIRSSVERLVEWMNKFGGSAPYKLGLVELGIYELPNRERIIIPQTLLRTREACRHVVTVNLQGISRDDATITVTAPNQPTDRRKIAAAGTPLTEEVLAKQIREKNTPELVQIAETLVSRLKETRFKTHRLPSTVQYGVDVSGDFIPLVNLSAMNIWFQIPMRAVRVLGDEQFVTCKQTINKIANFYRPEDISDPTKTNALTPRYGILDGKVESFVEAVTQIAETVRSAVAEAEGKQ